MGARSGLEPIRTEQGSWMRHRLGPIRIGLCRAGIWLSANPERLPVEPGGMKGRDLVFSQSVELIRTGGGWGSVRSQWRASERVRETLSQSGESSQWGSSAEPMGSGAERAERDVVIGQSGAALGSGDPPPPNRQRCWMEAGSGRDPIGSDVGLEGRVPCPSSGRWAGRGRDPVGSQSGAALGRAKIR